MGIISYGRVVDIILDEGLTDEEKKKFKLNGEWAGVGVIYYKSVQTPIGEEQSKTPGQRAYPYFSQF